MKTIITLGTPIEKDPSGFGTLGKSLSHKELTKHLKEYGYTRTDFFSALVKRDSNEQQALLSALKLHRII